MAQFTIRRTAAKAVMTDETFAEQYIQLRRKEGRVYSDEEVLLLPSLEPLHPHYKEWLVRKHSSDKLLQYLKKKGKALDMLEIGCGNGWLTAQLAGITSGQVTGIDINGTELEQAKKLFGHLTNIDFQKGNPATGILGDKKFDVIVFAASIQYFKSLHDILELALEHLTLQGEIHIVDTKFYEYKEIAPAQDRSKAYYSSIGFPEMADHYFHHFLHNLEIFQHELLYDPSSWWNKFKRRHHPFHWIVLKNRYR